MAAENIKFTERLLNLLEKNGVYYEKNKRSGDLKKWANDNCINYGALYNIITKYGYVTGWDYLVKFSDIFGVTIDYLLKGVGEIEEAPKTEEEAYVKKLIRDEALAEKELAKKQFELEKIREQVKDYKEKLQ